MATAFGRILIPSTKFIIKKAVQTGHILFNKHLLLTNALLSTLMGGVGDIIQQHYDVIMSKKNAWEVKRTFHMCVAGTTTGTTSHFWYIFLDKWLPGKCFRVIMKKVLYDQILFSPVCLTVYFTTLGFFRGFSTETIREELLDKGSTIYLAEWIIWPPAQVLNFYVLPTRFRVAFDNMVSLGFDIYSPYVVHRKQTKVSENSKGEDVNKPEKVVVSSRL